jgi:NAD(P)-dependent dehydrogenase (short-subunit alcohol dehydrogenase family)
MNWFCEVFIMRPQR